MSRYRTALSLLAAALPFWAGPAGASSPLYGVTNLGTLKAPYNVFSISGRINNSGQITFQSFGEGKYAFGHVGLWTPTEPNGTTLDSITDIEPNADERTVQSGGSGINSSGQVAGFGTAPPAKEHVVTGFVWSPPTRQGSPGDLRWMTTSLGYDFESHVWALNNRTATRDAQMVGSGYLLISGSPCQRPMLWDKLGIQDLGVLNGDDSGDANDINDATEIVGFCFARQHHSDPATNHAFLWSNGSMVGLGALPGDSGSVAAGINASGEIVGNSFSSTRGSHAFFFAPDVPNGSTGTLTDPGLLKGFTNSTAFALNARGQMVGRMFQGKDTVYPTGHAFLWDNTGGLRDLNDAIDPASGWKLESATGINDVGQITGVGTYTDPKTKKTIRRAFLLTSLPGAGA